MTQQVIGVGTTVNDGTGDPLRAAFIKVNANESDLYANKLNATGGTITDYTEGIVAAQNSGTGLTLNCALGNYFLVTMTGNWTVSWSNVPSVGAFSAIVRTTQGSSAYTKTEASGTIANGGVKPTISTASGAVDYWVYQWINGVGPLVTQPAKGAA